MKKNKIIAAVMSSIMCFSLAACGGGSSGSGGSIPSYSPLIFEIEIVDKK